MASPDCPSHSATLLVRMKASDVAMFRFLLEARTNLALFTTLERSPALLKLSFSPQSRGEVLAALDEIGDRIQLAWQDMPYPHV